MKYYVHTKTDKQGDHEVYREGYNRMPLDENRVHLGDFIRCLVPEFGRLWKLCPDAGRFGVEFEAWGGGRMRWILTRRNLRVNK
ncbi:hypothetical protein [Xenorhabdus bovienii]|uniref:hypothetical protein n=1 Tax=Xenorhabdus bovienii TaxID=40576 RepID=UPI003DA5B142